MYESPVKLIQQRIRSEISGKVEEAVYRAVSEIFVTVDKEELLRALNYDREQYDQGYKDGYLQGCADSEAKQEGEE